MFLLRKPTEAQVRRFLAAQGDLPFAYPAPGVTHSQTPLRGYVVDHKRVRLGHGADTWARAVTAVRRWEMFHLGWTQVYWPTTPIAVGSPVAVLAHLIAFWSLNAARILYVVAEDGPVARVGFAYGTLPDHVERGEERFLVEWRHADDSVWYDILAYSRPHHWLAAVGYPVARLFQHRFQRDSQRAMRAAARPPADDGR